MSKENRNKNIGEKTLITTKDAKRKNIIDNIRE